MDGNSRIQLAVTELLRRISKLLNGANDRSRDDPCNDGAQSQSEKNYEKGFLVRMFQRQFDVASIFSGSLLGFACQFLHNSAKFFFHIGLKNFLDKCSFCWGKGI